MPSMSASSAASLEARSGARARARSGSLPSHPVSEPVGRGAQRQLGVDPLLPRPVDDCEQLVSERPEGFFGVSAPRGTRPRLLISTSGILPPEIVAGGLPAPRRRRAPLHLARVQQRGQVLGDVAEDARLASLFAGLDL